VEYRLQSNWGEPTASLVRAVVARMRGEVDPDTVTIPSAKAGSPLGLRNLWRKPLRGTKMLHKQDRKREYMKHYMRYRRAARAPGWVTNKASRGMDKVNPHEVNSQRLLTPWP
jgi:hypothetical protein